MEFERGWVRKAIGMAGESTDMMPGSDKEWHGVAANGASGAGNEDVHDREIFLAFQKACRPKQSMTRKKKTVRRNLMR